MIEIKRYDIFAIPNGRSQAFLRIRVCEHGTWVFYADHEDAVESVKKRIEELENELRIWKDLDREDICGLCGLPGADKLPHPEHWPGERIPDTGLVHAECEQAECTRAHACLTDTEREAYLRTIH